MTEKHVIFFLKKDHFMIRVIYGAILILLGIFMIGQGLIDGITREVIIGILVAFIGCYNIEIKSISIPKDYHGMSKM